MSADIGTCLDNVLTLRLLTSPMRHVELVCGAAVITPLSFKYSFQMGPS